MKVLLNKDSSTAEVWAFPDVTMGSAEAASFATQDALLDLGGTAAREQAKKEGFDHGYQEGLQLGKQQAYADAKQEVMASYNDDLQQIVRTLVEPAATIEAELEQQLVNLSMRLARHIIGQELKLNPEIVISLVRKAIGILPISSKNTTVYVNHDDLEIVRAVFSTEQFENLIEDPALVRGECRVVADKSEVDATFDKRLDTLAKQVFHDAS